MFGLSYVLKDDRASDLNFKLGGIDFNYISTLYSAIKFWRSKPLIIYRVY